MDLPKKTMATTNHIKRSHEASESNESSVEQRELQSFAYSLGSYSLAPETDKAEQGTRQEAELLMSLCSSPVHFDKDDIEAISTSASESSYQSDSSSSRRDAFTFVCPSFSLENSEMAMRRIKHNDKVRRASSGILNDQSSTESNVSPPALLLKRPLKVDDRDAYRLSTEAMARNLSRSVQKALDWRMETWIHSLSLALVKKEKKMAEKGASSVEMQTLLRTSEAMLLTNLRILKSHLQVTGAGTGFRVLPQKVEGQQQQPVLKKRRRLSNDGIEEEEHLYTVTHELVFDGIVNLETPAGVSEVTLHIPGTIEGTFASIGNDPDTLRSVCLDVDTEFLALMLEKASRKVVRESLAMNMENTTLVSAEEEVVLAQPIQTFDNILQTPPPRSETTKFAPAAVRAALITPRSHSNRSPSDDDNGSSKFLRPIPDDLNDSTPSRISPQPGSPAFGPPHTEYSPQTPKADILTAAAALVSPTLKECTDYHEFPDNSPNPNLPMLVEVACREFRND